MLLLFVGSFISYTLILLLISRLALKFASKKSFFRGDRKTPWPVIAYGMIGASLSGLTLISVTGNILNQNFYYIPMVVGFALGYVFIAEVLLPIYYKMNLTSIYSYLGERFGKRSHLVGSGLFVLSRLLGTAVRIYLMIIVLVSIIPPQLREQYSGFGVFLIVLLSFMFLLYFYTYRAGVQGVIWTDVFQTTLMILCVVFSIIFLSKMMSLNVVGLVDLVLNQKNPNLEMSRFSEIFNWDFRAGTNVFKQLIAGFFVCVAMTGLDQSMMQKNLSCKDLKSSKRNIYMLVVVILVVNLVLLSFGVLMYTYFFEYATGLAPSALTNTDQLYSTIITNYAGLPLKLLFLFGLISAAYPSAAAALTSLTTSVCLDFRSKNEVSPKQRKLVQAGIAFLLFALACAIYFFNNSAVIDLLYKLASYTYGPLLGLFFFAIFTKYKLKDTAVPYVAVAAPIVSYLVSYLLLQTFDFSIGFANLLFNAALMFLGLYLSRK